MRLLAAMISATIVVCSSLSAAGEKQAILFKWDGVLASTTEPIRAFAIVRAEKYGYYQPYNDRLFFELNPYFPLLTAFGFPQEKQSLFRKDLSDYLAHNADITKIPKDIVSAIQNLKKAGYSLNIMCEGSPNRVHTVLKKYNLEDSFDGIFGTGPDEARPTNLSPKNTLCVVDDAGIAKEYQNNGLHVIGACWGMNSELGFTIRGELSDIPLIQKRKHLEESIPEAFRLLTQKEN